MININGSHKFISKRKKFFIKKINLQENLFLFSILLTPILGVYEVLDLLNISALSFLPNLKLLKISKDVLIVLMIIFGIAFNYWTILKMNVIHSIVIVSTIFLSIFFSLFYFSIDAILSGIRWLFPLIFYFTLGNFTDAFYYKLASLLKFILILGVLIQFYEFFNMNGIYGLSLNGFSIRNPGYYLIPSSMAAFSLSSLYFIYIFEKKFILKIFYISVTTISVILTASGSGLFSLLIFLLFLLSRRLNKYFKFVIIAILAISIIAILPTISGRNDILSSPGGRLEILLNTFDFRSALFSTSFGKGTNTFISLRPDLFESDVSIITDSMFTSSIINCGILFLIVLFIELFIKIDHKKINSLLYISVFAPFFLTTVIFELFPVNLLMFLALNQLKKSNVIL